MAHSKSFTAALTHLNSLDSKDKKRDFAKLSSFAPHLPKTFAGIAFFNIFRSNNRKRLLPTFFEVLQQPRYLTDVNGCSRIWRHGEVRDNR